MVFLRALRAAVVCALPILLFICQISASTGRSHEITNIHFENVTQTTVDVVWNTSHPSTSQVLIARDLNYEPERWAPGTADTALVTTHRVTVDHLRPFYQACGDGQYYIYVASVDSHGEMSTAPGPQTVDGKNPLLPMRTLPTDTSGVPSFKTCSPMVRLGRCILSWSAWEWMHSSTGTNLTWPKGTLIIGSSR